MPTDEPTETGTGRRRCPVCWGWFIPNHPSNPYPRRYCSGACRIEDSRRRRARDQADPTETKLDYFRALGNAEDEPRETARARRLHAERRHPMDPD